MNISSSTPARPRLHPLLAAAAIAVIALSAVGIAAMTGVLPTGKAANAPAPDTAGAPIVAPSAPAAARQKAAAPAPVATPVAKPAPAPKVAANNVPAPPQATRAAATLPPPPPAPAPCTTCGTIENVRVVEQPGDASGLGAVAGGVIGGILGNQIGGGTGNKIATVAGAAGGAYAGHQIEKSRNKILRYEVDVRMTDGSLRTLKQDTEPVWRGGDRVKIENGALVAQ